MTSETENENPAVFEGNLIGVKPVMSRGVYIFHIEVPEEQADQALKAIGGLPLAKESRRVAVARIADVAPINQTEGE